MQEILGDLFDHNSNGPSAVCITTNGFVSSSGRGPLSSMGDNISNTMGRGCALTAKQKWPGIQVTAAHRIRDNGNICQLLTEVSPGGGPILPIQPRWPNTHLVPYHIIAFPVKPIGAIAADDLSNVVKHMRKKVSPGQHIYGWACVANPKLIEKSAHELVALADKHKLESVVLPRPGCGAGELSWTGQIRDMLAGILDDRFWVITFRGGK
jgi:hypothetical protein